MHKVRVANNVPNTWGPPHFRVPITPVGASVPISVVIFVIIIRAADAATIFLLFVPVAIVTVAVGLVPASSVPVRLTVGGVIIMRSHPFFLGVRLQIQNKRPRSLN
jgi:hypothetical protein